MPLNDALSATARSHACLVLQAKGTGSSALPSKVYQIMAHGRPVVAVCDNDSGVAAILRTSGAGVSVEPGDAQGLADAIQALAADPDGCEAKGAAGKRYVAENANLEVATKKYLDLFESIIGKR